MVTETTQMTNQEFTHNLRGWKDSQFLAEFDCFWVMGKAKQSSKHLREKVTGLLRNVAKLKLWASEIIDSIVNIRLRVDPFK